jgi:hypothetical protein
MALIMQGSYAYTPQPPKRAKVVRLPAMSGSGEKMPSKSYSTNKNAIVTRGVQKPQPLSTLDERLAVAERNKLLLHIRYKLQRWFLQEASAPTELEVSAATELLAALELRPDLEWALVHETKIYKALKKVRDLSSIPGDPGDEFRKRCAALLDMWEKRRGIDDGMPPRITRRY